MLRKFVCDCDENFDILRQHNLNLSLKEGGK